MNNPATHTLPQIKLSLGDPVPRVMCIHEGKEVTAQRVRSGRTTEIAIKWGKVKFTLMPFDFDKVKYDFAKWFGELVTNARVQKPEFGK